jgi:hypothetical protein
MPDVLLPSRQDGGGRQRLSSSREEAMKHRYTIFALPVLVCGTVVAGSDHAWSARPIDPDMRHHRPAVVQPEPPERVQVEVEVDDTAAEALQTGAGVLGGAAVTMTGLWLYRRRHPLAAH